MRLWRLHVGILFKKVRTNCVHCLPVRDCYDVRVTDAYVAQASKSAWKPSTALQRMNLALEQSSAQGIHRTSTRNLKPLLDVIQGVLKVYLVNHEEGCLSTSVGVGSKSRLLMRIVSSRDHARLNSSRVSRTSVHQLLQILGYEYHASFMLAKALDSGTRQVPEKFPAFLCSFRMYENSTPRQVRNEAGDTIITTVYLDDEKPHFGSPEGQKRRHEVCKA